MSRKLVMTLSVGLAVLIVALALFGATGLRRYQKLRAEAAAMSQQNKKFSAENKQLREEVQRLKNNKQYIQQIARDELGQIKPGETVFLVPSEAKP